MQGNLKEAGGRVVANPFAGAASQAPQLDTEGPHVDGRPARAIAQETLWRTHVQRRHLFIACQEEAMSRVSGSHVRNLDNILPAQQHVLQRCISVNDAEAVHVGESTCHAVHVSCQAIL